MACVRQVANTKEPLYQELTAGGIRPFGGVAELIAAARAAGMGGEPSGGADVGWLWAASLGAPRRCDLRPAVLNI